MIGVGAGPGSFEVVATHPTRLFFPDKPRFNIEGEKVFTVNEGGNLIINLTATANPPEIEYKWTKISGFKRSIPVQSDDAESAGSRVMAIPGGSLNISKARRDDAGTYKVTATNALDPGKTKLKFKLDVHYPPK